jgi:serine O-acetyltransferase
MTKWFPDSQASPVGTPPVVDVHPWNLPLIVRPLRDARDRWRDSLDRAAGSVLREFPSREVLATVFNHLCGALFPMRLGPADLHQHSEDFYIGHILDLALRDLLEQAHREVHCDFVMNGRDPPCEEVDRMVSTLIRLVRHGKTSLT